LTNLFRYNARKHDVFKVFSSLGINICQLKKYVYETRHLLL